MVVRKRSYERCASFHSVYGLTMLYFVRATERLTNRKQTITIRFLFFRTLHCYRTVSSYLFCCCYSSRDTVFTEFDARRVKQCDASVRVTRFPVVITSAGTSPRDGQSTLRRAVLCPCVSRVCVYTTLSSQSDTRGEWTRAREGRAAKFISKIITISTNKKRSPCLLVRRCRFVQTRSGVVNEITAFYRIFVHKT